MLKIDNTLTRKDNLIMLDFILRIQQQKMKELWCNKEDEIWEDV